MSLEHMDNWEIYGGNTALMLNGVYAEIANAGVSLVADPDPTATGRVLRVNAPQGYLRYVLSAAKTVVGIAQRVWMPNISTGDVDHPRLMDFRDASNNSIFSMVQNPAGGLSICNAALAVLAQTPGPVIIANSWPHIEVKANFGGAGTVEIRVNGAVVLTANALAIAGPCAQIWWVAGQNTLNYMKDLVIWNGDGTVNNNFFGTVQVISMIPNADVALGLWTLTGGGTGFSILDNSPPVDTAYLDAAYPAAVGSTAQFGLTDCPIDVTSVRALQSMVRASKTDGGDGNLQNSIVSGASVGAGANRPITSAFTYWKDIFELDPATGLPWTVASANAAQLKTVRTV